MPNSGDLNSTEHLSAKKIEYMILKNQFQMVGLCALSYVIHLNGPVHKKARWRPCVIYSGCPVFKWLAKILDYLASDLFLTIQIPN